VARLQSIGDRKATVNPLELAAVEAFPEIQRLIDLRQRGGWIFQPVRQHGVDLLAGAREWPLGWSDAIAIRDIRDAKAFRVDPAGGDVWTREGSLIYVIDELMELPAPHEPLAPKLVKGSHRPTLWTPGPSDP
jgi:hypothetical protein